MNFITLKVKVDTIFLYRSFNIFVIDDMTIDIYDKIFTICMRWREFIQSITYKLLDQVCIVTKLYSLYEISLLWYEI